MQCVEGRAVTWEFSTPLSVKAGDFVGVHDKVGNLVSMHPCRGTKMLDANNVMRRLSTTDDPAVGDTVRVSDYPACITLRLDCFYVPDAYTG